MTDSSFSFIFIYSFIQGFTEFIPISSSGHLNLLENFWNKAQSRNLVFETTAHFSTLVALTFFLFFNSKKKFKDLIIDNYKLVLIGTIPAVALGFLIRFFNYNFISLKIIAISSISGAIILFMLDRFKSIKIKTNSQYLDFLVVGLFQCLAFIPGFSRSGACISGFLLIGKSKEDAIFYSLLMGFPIITLSFLSNYDDIIFSKINFDLYLVFFISFIVAYTTLVLFIKYINKLGFLPYIVYRILLGIIILNYLA